MNFKFDLEPSVYDSRDYPLSAILKTEEPLPPRTNNRIYKGPVYMQGGAGFCWAYGGMALKNWQENKQIANSSHRFSPLYLAAMVKASEYAEFPGQEGESVRAAIRGIKAFGATPEVCYPSSGYVPGSLKFPAITPEAIVKASKYTLESFARLETIDDIRKAIYFGGPILYGIYATSNFYDPGIIDIGMPNGRILGGHLLLGMDYDDTRNIDGHIGGIYTQNSWDRTWGEDGFCWLSYDYLRCNYDTKYLIDAYSAIDFTQQVSADKITMWVDKKLQIVDNVEMQLDQSPVIDPITNRTLVPARALAENMGYRVDYNEQYRSITYTKRGT